KPIDEDLLVASAAKTGKVVTCEEHWITGGLGSAVAEVLSEKCPTRMRRIGMKDRFGESGTAAELVAKYGLDGAGIAAVTREFIQS
ncbi:MAG: transketolase family protein, partial [Lachnospiraceae bacterium]|nr:transketolase family protein [Lachnospiraceae bacterium]